MGHKSIIEYDLWMNQNSQIIDLMDMVEAIKGKGFNHFDKNWHDRLIGLMDNPKKSKQRTKQIPKLEALIQEAI